MSILRKKITEKESVIILYGLTPPKVTTNVGRLCEIAEKQCERIRNLDIDGLILYDLQDESARNNSERPFPFIETLPPDEYAQKYLNTLDVPKIIYKSVGKMDEQEFKM